MGLADHLRELRTRLGISLLAIGACAVVVFIFWEPVYAFIRQPYCETTPGRENCNLFALGIFDQFKVRLRVAMIGGVVLAAPVWLYQLGAFITPALHRKERRYAAGFLATSLALFCVGIVFAYLTISQGLDFLLRIGGGDVTTLVSIQSYLSFVTLCLLAFGFAFQFPVVVTFLNMVGAFITPALHRNEKKDAAGFLAASLVLFATGTTFAYLTIAQGLDFLLSVGGEDVYTITSVQSYLSFVTLCLLAFGVAFEFPVVVTFLNMVGAFPVETMKRVRRYMYVGIFAASAVITPSQDPFTFVIMAVPICFLYEGCILLARLRARAARRRRAADPVAALGDDETSTVDLTPSPLDDPADTDRSAGAPTAGT